MRKIKKESDYIMYDNKYNEPDSLLQDAKESFVKIKKLNQALSKELDEASKTLNLNESDNSTD